VYYVFRRKRIRRFPWIGSIESWDPSRPWRWCLSHGKHDEPFSKSRRGHLRRLEREFKHTNRGVYHDEEANDQKL
jgi:hypothetical protein